MCVQSMAIEHFLSRFYPDRRKCVRGAKQSLVNMRPYSLEAKANGGHGREDNRCQMIGKVGEYGMSCQIGILPLDVKIASSCKRLPV